MIIYIILDIFLNKTYIEAESPSGNVVFSISEGKYLNETLNSCEELVNTKNSSCKTVDFHQIYRSTGSDMFILTYSDVTSYGVNTDNNEYTDYDNQVNMLKKVSYEYPGSLLPNIKIDFKLSSSFLSVSTKNQNDIINLIDKKNKRKTENISLSIGEILENYLNISLDSMNEKQNQTYRESGLSVQLKVECSNIPYVRMNVFWLGIGTSRMNRFDCDYTFELDDLEDKVIRNEFALTNNIGTINIYTYI